jgi:hypothetical protein
VARDSPVHGPEDLAGKRVCSVVDTTSLATIARVAPTATLVAVPNWDDCLVVLQQGQADAASTDNSILAGMAVQDPNLQIVRPSMEAEPYGIGVNKSQDDLVRAVNASLERVRRDGTCRCTATGSRCSARYRDHRNRSIGTDGCPATTEPGRSWSPRQDSPQTMAPCRTALGTAAHRRGPGRGSDSRGHRAGERDPHQSGCRRIETVLCNVPAPGRAWRRGAAGGQRRPMSVLRRGVLVLTATRRRRNGRRHKRRRSPSPCAMQPCLATTDARWATS